MYTYLNCTGQEWLSKRILSYGALYVYKAALRLLHFAKILLLCVDKVLTFGKNMNVVMEFAELNIVQN